MYKIHVQIEGLAPFLFNAYGESPKNDTPEEKRKELAKSRAYRNAQGVLILPKNNIESMLVQCCKEAKQKEAKRMHWQLVNATVFAEGPGSFGVKDCEMLTVMGRVPPRTGAMVPIYRPMLPTGWKLTFTLCVVDDSRDHERIQSALERGGLYVGVGSWRPKYGRFIIKTWKVELGK